MDITAIKARLDQLQQATTKTSSLWKPSPGKTQVRIVPYKYNKDNPFIELYFHYDLVRYICPTPVTHTCFFSHIASAGLATVTYAFGRCFNHMPLQEFQQPGLPNALVMCIATWFNQECI